VKIDRMVIPKLAVRTNTAILHTGMWSSQGMRFDLAVSS